MHYIKGVALLRMCNSELKWRQDRVLDRITRSRPGLLRARRGRAAQDQLDPSKMNQQVSEMIVLEYKTFVWSDL